MPADDRPGEPLDSLDRFAAETDLEIWGGADGGQHSLVDLVNRVLDKGVCITGDVTISVAGVDLVYLGLNVILTSVASARQRIDPDAGPRRELPEGGERGS